MKRVVVAIAFLLLFGGISTARDKDSIVVRIDSLSTQTIFTKSLAGKVPGVMVSATDGMPDSTPSIYFRGYSVYGGSPYILLNGLPYFGDISSLNANDIESVTVLKDVSDILLYGDEAVNGILSVRTRQTSRKGLSITASWRTGAVLRQGRDYRTMDTPGYLETWWEAWRNNYLETSSPSEAGNKALAMFFQLKNPYGLPASQIINPATGKFIATSDPLWNDDLNWRDYVERTGILHDGSLAVNYGSRLADFRASLGYTDDNSYVIGAGFKRYSAAINAEIRPFTGFRIASSILGTVSSRNGWQSRYSENPFSFVRHIGNLYPVHQHNADGSYRLTAEGDPILDFGFDSRTQYAGMNAAGMMEFDRSNETKRRMLDATLNAEWRLLEHFTLEASGNLAFHSKDLYVQQGYKGGNGGIITDFVSSVSNLSEQRDHSLRGAAAYEQDFGKIGVGIRAGYEQSVSACTYDQEKKAIGIAASVGESTPRYTATVSYGGWFSSANLRIFNALTLSGTIRLNDIHRTTDRENVTILTPDAEGLLSYGLDVGWNVDRLPFLSGLQGLDRLQLNLSFGQMGNATSGDIQEITAGVSFALFNRIHGSVNWYDRMVSDSLSMTTMTVSSGTISYVFNGPVIRNRGLEIELGADIVKTSRFLVSFSGNVNLMNDSFEDTGNGSYNNGYLRCEAGHHPRSFWLPVYIGADPSTGKPLYRALDSDDPSYETYSSQIFTVDGRQCTNNTYAAKSDWVGKAAPTLVGGVELIVKYKSLALSLDGYFQTGGTRLDIQYRDLMSAKYNRSFGRLHTDLERRWKNPGDHTDVPAVNATGDLYESVSSRWLVSTDAFEFTRACLSYDLALPSVKGVSGVTIYFAANNFLMISAREGVYPRQGIFDSAIPGSVSAPARTFSLGARFSLGG